MEVLVPSITAILHHKKGSDPEAIILPGVKKFDADSKDLTREFLAKLDRLLEGYEEKEE